MKVSYLTDPQVREEYLRLLTRIDEYTYEITIEGIIKDKYEFWSWLGYDKHEIPDY